MNLTSRMIAFVFFFGVSFVNAVNYQCGIKSDALSDAAEQSQNEWPWVGRLVYKSKGEDRNGRFFCGSTLISMKSVVTAGHCMYNQHEAKLRSDDFEVHLGRHLPANGDEMKISSQVLAPIYIAVHPDWNPTDKENHRNNSDLALIIAGRNIELSSFISPACLPHLEIFSENVIGTIIGWGTLEIDEGRVEANPKGKLVKMVPKENCLLEEPPKVKGEEGVSQKSFCVQGVEGDASRQPSHDVSTRRYSGGGFFVKSGETWSIEGLFSSDVVAENSNKFSVYIQLSSFSNWIQEGQQFYAAKFSCVPSKYFFTDQAHDLTVQGPLRQGAFLSTLGNSVDLNVLSLKCSDQNLGNLPNNIGHLFPKLKKLNAYSLKLKFLERVNFENMDHLEELSLFDNLIQHIPFDTFFELRDLKEISLSRNKLKVIHANTYTKNPSLVSIILHGNQIHQNEIRNLKHENLEVIDLSRNKLKAIPYDSFYGMENLKQILVDSNYLTTFHDDTFLRNPNLTELHVNFNDIQSLSGGLFRNNRHLSYFNALGNQITEINCAFLAPGIYDFEENVCISKEYKSFNSSELDEMNSELRRLCGKK